jgi:hypothetical protein
MSQQKLTIVPITLHPESKKSSQSKSSTDPSKNATFTAYGLINGKVVQLSMPSCKE